MKTITDEGGTSSCNIAADWSTMRALSASGDTLMLWSLESGECRQTLGGHEDEVFAVEVDWFRMWAFSGSSGGQCKIWNLDSGECLLTLTGHADIVRTVSVDWLTLRRRHHEFGDTSPKFWNFEVGSYIFTVEGHLKSVAAKENSLAPLRHGVEKHWDL